MPPIQTGITTAIRRIVFRETGVSRHHWGPHATVQTITAFYRIGGFKGSRQLGHYYAERH